MQKKTQVGFLDVNSYINDEWHSEWYIDISDRAERFLNNEEHRTIPNSKLAEYQELNILRIKPRTYSCKSWAIIAKAKISKSILLLKNPSKGNHLISLLEAYEAIHRAEFVYQASKIKREVKKRSEIARANGSGKHKKNREIKKKVESLCATEYKYVKNALSIAEQISQKKPEYLENVKINTIAKWVRKHKENTQ